ncbi:MAG: hypothetical protein V8R80_07475 [Eubacterium sp.]
MGCENTHFKNPHGLDAKDHYSTARNGRNCPIRNEK